MTEEQWLSSQNPAEMVRFVTVDGSLPGDGPNRRIIASARKLRLFCCACCRLAGTKPETVDRHEKYGVSLDDERISDADWAKHWTEEGTSKVTLAVRADLIRHIFTPFAPPLSRPCGRCDSSGEGTDEYNGSSIIKGGCPRCSGRGHFPISPPTEKCGRCEGTGKRKHVDSGPYGYGPRTVEYEPCAGCSGSGVLPSFPTIVVQLAEACYAQVDCSFALSDAIREMGMFDELADHFGKETYHPRGCCFVDAILGKD